MGAKRPYIFELRGPLGGINNTLPDWSIADNELSDARNYEPDMTGTGMLIKRLGLTQSDDTAGAAYSIFDGKNGKYWHCGTAMLNHSGTSLATGLAAAYDSWASFQAYDLFVNGTDAQKTSNGTSFSAISNIPAGVKYIASANNFLYAAGHDHGKLQWANIGVAETWDATNILTLTQDEDDDIVAMQFWRNGLLVLTQLGHGLVYGSSNTVQNVGYWNREQGCEHNRSLCITPFGAFWYGNNGLVWLKPDLTIDLPMDRKLSYIKTQGLGTANTNFGVYDALNSRVIYFLRLAGGGGGTPIRMDYYPETDSFYLHNGTLMLNQNVLGLVNASTNPTVYSADNTTGLYSWAGNTDNATAISAYFETKREGSIAMDRTPTMVVLSTDLGGTETITYKWYVNNETTPAAAHVFSPSVVAGDLDTEFLVNQYHHRIKHRVEDAATVTRTRITGLTHFGMEELRV